MKKRALSLLLALLLCLSLLPAAVYADDDEETTDPDPIETTEPETPEPETPEPETPDFSGFDLDLNNSLIRYTGPGGDVNIPYGITQIGWEAFKNNRLVTSVTIPSSVTAIGREAFYDCKGLHSVTIPSSVTSIGQKAFAESSLHSVTIPSSVTSIGQEAFYSCGVLSRVTFEPGLTFIGEDMFMGCTGLTSVTFPSSLTSIGDGAFWATSLTSVTIPSSVTRIGNGAFAGCESLTSVTIEPGVTSIGDSAFYSCKALTSVTIGSGVTSIGEHAFERAFSLTSVNIPASVTSIGETAFEGCLRLKDVYYGGTQAQWKANGFGDSKYWVHAHYITDVPTIHCSDGNIGDRNKPAEDVEVTVYFDSNGGSSVSDKTVTVGETYGSLPTPTRDGDIFDGWYTSRTGGTRVTSSTTVDTDYDHTLYAHWIQADAKLNVSPHSVSFDKVKVGYTQPAAKTVTVTNIGEVDVTLSQPSSGNFDLGTLSKTKLAPGASATFTVRPKAGLKAGSYSDSITVKSTDGKASPAVSVSFTVERETQKPADSGFTDVADASAYYYDPVMWAVEKGVTTGTGANTFSPDTICTRGQVVTFLYRAAGAKPVSSGSPFKDVSNSKDYYYDPVLWAVANNITGGTSADAFSPNAACTRGQVVTFLWRASGKPEPKTSSSQFDDVKDTGAYYYKAVLWAVENGITSGTSATAFSPDDACTRGQIVTFLYRAYK